MDKGLSILGLITVIVYRFAKIDFHDFSVDSAFCTKTNISVEEMTNE